MVHTQADLCHGPMPNSDAQLVLQGECFRGQGYGKFADHCKEEAEEELEEAKKCTARIITLGGKPESLFDIVSSLCNKTAESAKTVYRIIDGEEDLRYNANDQKCGIRNFKH